MKNHSDDWQELQRKVLGLGDSSIRKSHYPTLRQRLSELERFRSLVDMSSDLLFVLEYPSGTIQDVSASACESLGVDCASLLGQPFSTLVPAQTWAEMVERFEELRHAPKRNAIITTEIGREQDARKLPVEIAVQLLRVGDSEYAVLAARDITERRRAEQRIFKLNRLYAVITQVNQAIVKLQDRDALFAEVCRLCVERGHFRTAWIGLFDGQNLRPVVSAGADAILRNEGAQFLGNCRDIVREGSHYLCNDLEGRPDIPCHAAALQCGFRSSSMMPLKVAGKAIGALALYSAEAHFFDQEEVELLDGVASDISFALESLDRDEQRRRAERILAEAHRQIEAIFDASPLAIIAADITGSVTAWNKAATELFGWRADETMGRPVPIIAADQRSEHEVLRNRVHSGEVCAGVELKRARRDGTLLDVSMSAAPMRDPEGRVIGFVATYADVTDQKRMEAQLLEAQKLESLGRLAGGVAHDFNNLLAVINGHTEIALNRLTATHPTSSNLNEIWKATQRAANLTRQLLAFGRKQVLQSKIVSINAVIEDVEAMLRTLTGETVDLVTMLDPAVGGVKADPGQLQQVLMNLVVNARDAIRNQGTITIRTATKRITPFASTSEEIPPGEYVTLSVSDDGSGISEEIQRHIFEPFFTTKETGKGTGLGLSTVWGVVKQSEGHIEIKSKLNQGTTFTIYLPRVESEERAEVGAAGGAGALHGTETILVVEDQSQLRELMPEILKSFGYRVLQAANPAEAMSVWQRHAASIRLVITDVVMPGMTGPELGKLIRSSRADVKILYMSGHSSETVMSEDTLLHDAAFLEKPFSATKLAAAVRELLDHGSKAAARRTA